MSKPEIEYKFEFDYEKLAEYLPGSYMPTDETLFRIEQYLTEQPVMHAVGGGSSTCWGFGQLSPRVKGLPSVTHHTFREVVEELDGFKCVWLNTMTGEFSNSWPLVDNKYINMEDARNGAAKGWKLIRYRCDNQEDFEFSHHMKLR